MNFEELYTYFDTANRMAEAATAFLATGWVFHSKNQKKH
jgi:hypothetical protein